MWFSTFCLVCMAPLFALAVSEKRTVQIVCSLDLCSSFTWCAIFFLLPDTPIPTSLLSLANDANMAFVGISTDCWRPEFLCQEIWGHCQPGGDQQPCCPPLWRVPCRHARTHQLLGEPLSRCGWPQAIQCTLHRVQLLCSSQPKTPTQGVEQEQGSLHVPHSRVTRCEGSECVSQRWQVCRTCHELPKWQRHWQDGGSRHWSSTKAGSICWVFCLIFRSWQPNIPNRSKPCIHLPLYMHAAQV